MGLFRATSADGFGQQYLRLRQQMADLADNVASVENDTRERAEALLVEAKNLADLHAKIVERL